jgi:hypothetical protein
MLGPRFWSLVWVAALSGCSPQAKLVSDLAQADRVVLQKPGLGRGATISIQGDEIHQLVRAISLATPDGTELAPDNAFAVLQFLKGTNQIAILQCGPGRFWLNGKGYRGQTGDLLDLCGGGPIHFRISNGFRGFIYFILNTRNGSEITRSDGVYTVMIPADGIVSVRDPGLLYSWAEKAEFMGGQEIPLGSVSEFAGPLTSTDSTVSLRSLGAFSANGLSFATFHIGTEWDFHLDRFARVAPQIFGGVPSPMQSRACPTPLEIGLLTILGALCWGILRRGAARKPCR